MIIDSIQNGIVIDHISAGKAMELYNILGLDRLDFIVIFAGLVLVAIVSHFREKNIDVHDKIAKACLPVRWAAYIGLIMLVVIFGAYGPGYQEVNLIYAGF